MPRCCQTKPRKQALSEIFSAFQQASGICKVDSTFSGMYPLSKAMLDGRTIGIELSKSSSFFKIICIHC